MCNLQVKNSAISRGITHLYHFTQLDNLESIFRYGIVSRDELDNSDTIHGYINDSHRLDGLTDSVSCSIEHINGSLFDAFRKRTRTNWAVIQLKASVLWEMECAFCATNAANNRVRRLPVNYLQTERAFDYMFFESPFFVSRKDLNRSNNQPTDPQAEVLVFGTIKKPYFTNVFVEGNGVLNKLGNQFTDINFLPFDK